MKQLNYQTLQDLNYDGYLLNEAPERVLQFGEGNFMRAFVDFFIDKMNETANFNSKVVLVQPIPKFTTPDVGDFINEQEGLYTLYLRGSENGQEVSSKRVISCISRCLNAYSDYEQLWNVQKIPNCVSSPAIQQKPESYMIRPVSSLILRQTVFRQS